LSGNAIIIEGLQKSFGSKRVLQGLSGTIDEGKVVGLIGRNGEGKTTLFRILTDLLQSDSGTVEIAGVRPDGTGRIRSFTGYIPERPTFHEFMSVKEVLDFHSQFYESWNWPKALSGFDDLNQRRKQRNSCENSMDLRDCF
jgi:ABC-2 type transport system ATP-binding protein